MIRRAIKRRNQSTRRVSLHLECLEGRQLMAVDASSAVSSVLAGSPALTAVRTGLIAYPVSTSAVNAALAASASATPAGLAGPATPGPYTPTQIRHAYGVDQLSQTGAGQTIAIIDAYDNPTIAGDLNTFDTKFSLPAATFQEAYYSGTSPTGTTTTPPAYNSGWALEIALDVEWSHAVAPGAKILLVEAPSANTNDLFGAVNYAISQGASQVSMSFGGSEFSGVSSFDSYFNNTAVSFFASAGDNGAEVEFPAVSPYVVGVGGTTISLDAAGDKLSETTWADGGGGTSAYVSRPSYQNGFQSSTDRGVPDVAYDADPNSGVYVVDNGSYYGVGGTSAGSPQWAGLAALVNQGRVANGLATIGTGLTYGINSALYALAGGSSYTNPNGDFLDITTGSNGNPATTGYDTATGLGSPVANKLVPDLIAFGASSTGTPTVGDAGFEAVSVAGPGTSDYAYNPSGSAWTFGGQAGLSGNGSGFTSGNPAAPQGSQVAFLQNQGTITQTVANFAAGSYTLSFLAAQRANYGTSNETFAVMLDGTNVGTFDPSSTSYQTYRSNVFSLAAGSHIISFVGMGPSGGDNTAFLDNVTLAQATASPTPTVGDAGFENVAVGSSYAYDPSGSAWTFGGQAGVSGNGSGFTSGNPAAPQGSQVAFLQNQGTITQTVANFAAGNYTLSFSAAQRANYGSSNEIFAVMVDTTVVATFDPSSTSYQTFKSASFAVTAGSHIISFVGMGPSGGDNTAFLDNVTLAPSSTPPTPVIGDAGFENVAVGSSYAYDPSGSAWTFGGQAGVSGNGSGFTSGNPAAPQGSQVAFLQNQGTITQTIVNSAAGNYTLSFSAAQRANFGTSNETFAVMLDGNSVGTLDPSTTTYQTYRSNVFSLAAGSHTISFVGMGPSGGDNTVFLDNVTIAVAGLGTN